MDGLGFRVLECQSAGYLREFEPVRSGVGNVKCRPVFGSTAQKTLAVPQRSYSLSCLASRPGMAGRAYDSDPQLPARPPHSTTGPAPAMNTASRDAARTAFVEACGGVCPQAPIWSESITFQ